jgi:hypothetical protein
MSQPAAAAVLLDEVESALGGRFHGGPRYLILVESLRSHWPRAWVFYPSSDETPAYVKDGLRVNLVDLTGRFVDIRRGSVDLKVTTAAPSPTDDAPTTSRR